MFGIWSAVSKRWCFGIIADTQDEARKLLWKHIGYNSLKTRFQAKQLSKGDIIHIKALHAQHEVQKGAGAVEHAYHRTDRRNRPGGSRYGQRRSRPKGQAGSEVQVVVPEEQREVLGEEPQVES